jgi:shikimate kinase/3-dehydroquinate synthase
MDRLTQNGAAKLVVVGFMGAGKTTTARESAAALGVPFADADSEVERRLGEPIADFFDRQGEEAFRDVEEEVVLELLADEQSGVVSLGGGAVQRPAVTAALVGHVCVYLPVDDETAWERAGGSERPLARDRGAFEALHAVRRPLYEGAARVMVPARAERESRVRALRHARALLRPEVPGSVRMLWADVGQGHPVWVGPGVLRSAGALWMRPGRCFVVADEMAHALHGGMLEDALAGFVEVAETVLVPPGERNKTLGEAERILRALAAGGMQRNDTIVAFGGGVLGDLAGFCAATYQRGVAVVQVPTTIVAQVDSAYGGKTAIDLPEGKNYVGAFHQPAAVFTDPALTATLPEDELRAGFAEVIKTGLIAGEPLWGEVTALDPLGVSARDDLEKLTHVIEGCARVKLDVVSRDELDAGQRAALNLGHTFAHALEAATGYETFRHGEAVGLGLLVALRLSELEAGLSPAVRESVHGLLELHGLPTSFSGPSTDELLDLYAADKKRRGNRQNLVLLREPGDVLIGAEAPRPQIGAAIDEIRQEQEAAA